MFLPLSFAGNRQKQAFLNDLQQAMVRQKRLQNNPESTGNSGLTAGQERPFPNRFSSGEYENVHQHQTTENKDFKAKVISPKRSGDNAGNAWNRT